MEEEWGKAGWGVEGRGWEAGEGGWVERGWEGVPNTCAPSHKKNRRTCKKVNTSRKVNI